MASFCGKLAYGRKCNCTGFVEDKWVPGSCKACTHPQTDHTTQGRGLPSPPVRPAAQPSEEPTIQCPTCASVLRQSAKFCVGCGNRLLVQPSASASRPLPQPSPTLASTTTAPEPTPFRPTPIPPKRPARPSDAASHPPLPLPPTPTAQPNPSPSPAAPVHTPAHPLPPTPSPSKPQLPPKPEPSVFSPSTPLASQSSSNNLQYTPLPGRPLSPVQTTPPQTPPSPNADRRSSEAPPPGRGHNTPGTNNKFSTLRSLVGRRAASSGNLQDAFTPESSPAPQIVKALPAIPTSAATPSSPKGRGSFAAIIRTAEQLWDVRLSEREAWEGDLEFAENLALRSQSPVSPACLRSGYTVECCRASLSHRFADPRPGEVDDPIRDVAFFTDILAKTEHETYAVLLPPERALGPVVVSVELPRGAERARAALKEAARAAKAAENGFEISAPRNFQHAGHLGVNNLTDSDTITMLSQALTSVHDSGAVKILAQHPYGDIRTSLAGEKVRKFSDRTKLVSAHLQPTIAAAFKTDAAELDGLKLDLLPDKAKSMLLKFEQQMISTHYKFGILYIKAGQQNEDQWFGNNDMSPGFVEFLGLLGDLVTLKGFQKFRGGLDVKKDTTGTQSYWTSFAHYEVMFHVCPLLPFQQSDLQKVERKRHIGNDVVCVVYKESDGPEDNFNPLDIHSQFLQTFIVVVPLNTSPPRYRISVANKPGVPPYGPFFPEQGNEMEFGPDLREWLLTKMINAERAAMYAPDFRLKLQRTRRELLEDIIAGTSKRWKKKEEK